MHEGHIVVGAAQADIGTERDAGKAYIFTWDGSGWRQQALLAASNAAMADAFGTQAIMNGNTVFVSAPNAAYQDGTDNGRIYLYTNQ